MRSLPETSLYLGHAADARDRHLLFRMGIAAVIDLAIEEPPAVPGHEIVYGRFPLVDGSDNPSWLIRAAIDMIAVLIRQHIPTLVACGGGLSRSPLLAAAALVRLKRHPSLQDALVEIANSGHCDVSAGLLRDVQAALND